MKRSFIVQIQILAQKFYDYSTYIKGYSKQTIRRYRYAINLYCKLCAIENIESINEENVRSLFFQGRTQRNWAPSTFLVFHKSLRVFFDWCKKEGQLNSNPIDTIDKPKQVYKLPKKLTKQQALQLLEVVNNYPYEHSFLRFRNYAIFATFLYAGLRLSECLNLNYTDVDLENRVLFVRQGKGGKDRIVPIANTLAESLTRYVEVRKKLSKTCPRFFTSYTRNREFSLHGLKHLVNKIQIAYGLKFTVHQLRHTFATLMLEGGCDIYSLSKMMGHSDIKTTTIYLSASAEHLRQQVMKHPLN